MNILRFVLIILIVLQFACNKAAEEERNEVIDPSNYPRLRDSISTEELEFNDSLFVTIMRELNEPISFDEQNAEHYRLQVYKIWDKDYVIRIKLDSTKLIVYKNTLDDFKGDQETLKDFEIQTVSGVKKKLFLLEQDTIFYEIKVRNELDSLIKGSYFWSLQKYEDRVVYDPEIYILEGYETNRGYHFVSRINPYSGTFKGLCYKIIELAEIDYEKD